MDEGKKYPHRKFMADCSDYVPIQDIVIPMIISGSASPYELLSHGIISDPLVVTINEQCRYFWTDMDAAIEVLRISSYFSDSSSIYEENGVEYIPILDLYFEYRDRFQELGIKNQYELRGLLSHLNVITRFDSVKLQSLQKISEELCPVMPDEEEFDECLNEEQYDIDDGDDLVSLILEYVKQFGGSLVPWEKVSRDLMISMKRLEELKPSLKSDDNITLTEKGLFIKTIDNRSEEESSYDTSKSQDTSRAVRDLMELVKTIPDKPWSFRSIAANLSIPFDMVGDVVQKLNPRDGFEISNGAVTFQPNLDCRVQHTKDNPSSITKSAIEYDSESLLRLFENRFTYVPPSLLVSRFYQLNPKSKASASEIMESMSDSPFIIKRPNGDFRLILYSADDILSELMNHGIQDMSDFNMIRAVFDEHPSLFKQLNVNSEEFIQLVSKIDKLSVEIIGKETSSKVSETESVNNLKKLIEIIMSDYRKRTSAIICGRLSTDYSIDVDVSEVETALDELLKDMKMMKVSPKFYRSFRSEINMGQVKSILNGIHDVIYHRSKLYSKYQKLWNNVGITDSYEMLYVLNQIDSIEIIKEDLISFDRADFKSMIRNYSYDELQNEYGLNRRRLRC